MGGDPATAQTRSLMAKRRSGSSSYVVDTSYIGRSRGVSSHRLASRRQCPLPGDRADRRATSAAPLIPFANGRMVTAVSPRTGNVLGHPRYGILLDQLWMH